MVEFAEPRKPWTELAWMLIAGTLERLWVVGRRSGGRWIVGLGAAGACGLALSGRAIGDEPSHRFEVVATDGSRSQGELVRWDDESVSLRDGAEEHSYPHESLTSLHALGTNKRQIPITAVTVELRDGTRVMARQFTVADGSASVTTFNDHSLTCPLKSLAAVRLGAADRDRDAAWLEIRGGRHEGDVLVVRRDAAALDFLDGTIVAVADEDVTFQLGDETLQVPRSRLEGLLFFSSGADPPESAIVSVTDVAGNTWHGRSVRLSGTGLEVSMPGGTSLTVPLDEVLDARFATRGVTYLSDLTPQDTTIRPGITPRDSLKSVIRLLYEARADRSLDSRPLQLYFPKTQEWRTYDKGLSLHSWTRRVYVLDGSFRELRGWVGLDPRFGTQGQARVEIRAGDDLLFGHDLFRGSEPVELAVPMPAARRLEILIDYLDGSDVGDHVNLCDLRLLQ